MSDATQIADTIRTQTLELIKQGQQATVEATKTWAGLVTQSVPQGFDAADVAARLPDPTQVTEQIFDFAEQLLATQREFVTALAGAVKPVSEATKQRAQAAATAATGAKSKKK